MKINLFFLLYFTALSSASTPIVDLGYGIWQATNGETPNGHAYYNFSNIRYAQAPVGTLRFAAPKPPLVNRTHVNDGQDGRVCAQGSPGWSDERKLFTDAYLANPKNISIFEDVPGPGINVSAKPKSSYALDGRTNEDCLFLEVLVPKNVYGKNTTAGAPIMVWINGGGFYEGSMESQGDPAGLLGQGIANPDSAPGIIHVAINYRLGALGWLSGPTFNASGGLLNAGLYDQRMAFQWIQSYIHLFGGDRTRVTAMGASAGGSSILHQLTAYSGSIPCPFSQAFVQSPAFDPNPYPSNQEEAYVNFLHAANASSLAELRALPSETVIEANSIVVFNASQQYGSNGGYGLVVDGTFVQDIPARLLRQGKYARNVRRVFTGHNTDEGLIFTDPAVQNTSAFDEFLPLLLPLANASTLSLLKSTLYPPIFTNVSRYGYNDTISRLATLQADLLLTCNAYALLEAFGANKSHAYLFEEGASLHAEETPYMFYNYTKTPDTYGLGDVNATVAKELQDWVVSFVARGDPDGPGAAKLPFYGENRTMGVMSNKGVGLEAKDPAGKERCEFWINGEWF